MVGIATVVYGHCALVALQVGGQWKDLAHKAELDELSPRPGVTAATSEERRKEVNETWEYPTLTLTGRQGELTLKLYELRRRRCWPESTPANPVFVDEEMAARCDSMFFGSMPAGGEERSFLAHLARYEAAIHILGGPEPTHADVIRRIADPNEYPGVMTGVQRIGFAFNFHRYSGRYVGPLLLAVAAAFSMLFVAREVGLLVALLHAIVLTAYGFAWLGLTQQFLGNEYRRLFGGVAIAHVLSLAVIAVLDRRGTRFPRLRRSPSIMLVLTAPFWGSMVAVAVGVQFPDNNAIHASSLVILLIGIPFAHLLPSLALRVFLSYSEPRTNPVWRNFIEASLQPSINAGLVSLFVDEEGIGAGTLWHARIQAELRATDVAIVLLSPRFLSSTYAMTEELPVLLARHRRGELELRLVVAEECEWEHQEVVIYDRSADRRVAVLGEYQVVNRGKISLALMSPEDRNLVLSGLAADIGRLAQGSS